MSTATRLLSSIVLASCLSMLVVACGDDYDLSSSNTSQNAPKKDDDKIPQWLEPHHKITPAEWLIVRSKAALRGEVTSREHREKVLEKASENFKENPRLIANRAAQLEDMLLEIGIEESAISLIEQFSLLSNRKASNNFSAYCQYYFNLRAQGHDHEFAMKELQNS